jgi:hypothetical protein
MTNRGLYHYRWVRKLAFVLAAAPLFQLAQCDTGLRQTMAGVANSLPATMFSMLQSYLLLPLQLIFGGYSSTQL